MPFSILFYLTKYIFDSDAVLLEAPVRPHLKNSALLTIDLTTDVADEAIKRKDSMIIAYRKWIFVY